MLAKLKMALVLLMIGSISGALIYGANEITYQRIADNILEKEEGFYKEIFDIDETIEIDYVETELDDGLIQIIITMHEDGTLIGYVYKSSEKNNYGTITVLVGIKDGVIQNVAISDTTNTPNFVKLIENEYLSNFSGQVTTDVTYDTKTGASYTYGSVSDVVEKALIAYNAEGSDE